VDIRHEFLRSGVVAEHIADSDEVAR